MIVKITGSRWPGLVSRVGPFEGREYDVPPGAVLVEYIGDISPFDDQFVRLKLGVGGYTPDQAEIIREMARRAIKPWPRLRRFILKGQGPGEIKRFSRNYTWGTAKEHKHPIEPGEPGSFFQLMTNHDADLLKSDPSGYQFRMYPYEEPRLITPACDIRVVKREDIQLGRPFKRAMVQG